MLIIKNYFGKLLKKLYTIGNDTYIKDLQPAFKNVSMKNPFEKVY